MRWRKKSKKKQNPKSIQQHQKKKVDDFVIRLVGVLSGHNGAIYDVIPIENLLLTASSDHFIAGWDLIKKKQSGFSIKLDRSSYNFDYSPQSKTIAVGTNNGQIHIIDLENKEEIKCISYHKKAIFSVTYNEKTNHFYSGDEEGNFCVWDDKTFELLLTFPYNCGKIRKIALSHDKNRLAICGQDGYVRIITTDFFNLEHEFKANDDGVNCAVFDNDILYTGGKDAYINKWDWKKEEKTQTIPAHNHPVYDLALFQGNKRLVSVSFDKTIKIWDTSSLSIIERIEQKDGGHRHTVNRIAKISDNSFATVSDDRRILLWEMEN